MLGRNACEGKARDHFAEIVFQTHTPGERSSFAHDATRHRFYPGRPFSKTQTFSCPPGIRNDRLSRSP